MTVRFLPSLLGGTGATLLLFLALSLLAVRQEPPPSPAPPHAVILTFDVPPQETATARPRPALPDQMPAPPLPPDLPTPPQPASIPPEPLRTAVSPPSPLALDMTLPPGGDTPVLQAGTSSDALFDADGVDEPPRAVHAPPPDYPYAARRRGVSGEVVLRLVVETDGSVGLVEVVSARPPGVFEDSARLAVGAWRFTPGKRQGRPVRTRVRLPVTFRLE